MRKLGFENSCLSLCLASLFVGRIGLVGGCRWTSLVLWIVFPIFSCIMAVPSHSVPYFSSLRGALVRSALRSWVGCKAVACVLCVVLFTSCMKQLRVRMSLNTWLVVVRAVFDCSEVGQQGVGQQQMCFWPSQTAGLAEQNGKRRSMPEGGRRTVRSTTSPANRVHTRGSALQRFVAVDMKNMFTGVVWSPLGCGPLGSPLLAVSDAIGVVRVFSMPVGSIAFGLILCGCLFALCWSLRNTFFVEELSSSVCLLLLHDLVLCSLWLFYFALCYHAPMLWGGFQSRCSSIVLP